jgi:hypothetical protein
MIDNIIEGIQDNYMSEKQSTIKKLHAEIDVKDRIIGALLKEINANKVPIPTHILKILETLYRNRLQKENNIKVQ